MLIIPIFYLYQIHYAYAEYQINVKAESLNLQKQQHSKKTSVHIRYQLFSSHSCQVHPLMGLGITNIIILYIYEKLACPAFLK